MATCQKVQKHQNYFLKLNEKRSVHIPKVTKIYVTCSKLKLVVN